MLKRWRTVCNSVYLAGPGFELKLLHTIHTR